MTDLLMMLARAQDDERKAVHRGDEDVIRLARHRVQLLERLIERRRE